METKMTSALKSLTFTSQVPQREANPVMLRRRAIVQRLTQQLELAKDPKYARITHKNGQEKTHRVNPWWRPMLDGSIVFLMRNGHEPVQFEKGKFGVKVASRAELPGVISTLIHAVENGELDEQLKSHKPAVVRAKGKGK
jgi:hypothetical protein